MASPAEYNVAQCKRGRKCSKVDGHKGRCNSEKELIPFWKSSPVFNLNIRKRDMLLEEKRFEEESESKMSCLRSREEELNVAESEIEANLNEKDLELSSLQKAVEEHNKESEKMKKQLSVLTAQLDQLKTLISFLGLDPKQFSKSKRENNCTTKDMINDYKSSTRYRRRKQTEKALEFIHGGGSGSLYGAWDYIVANAPKDLVSELIVGYKKGKHLQQIFGKAMKEHQCNPEAMNHAIAMKYQNFLSRRKFTLVCKTQTSFFNADNEVWVPRNVKCLGVDLRLPQTASNLAVDDFVKNLNIGQANQIPGSPGVSRTVTGLIFMIIDLHLRVPHLSKKLIWFNELENHFIFQFSDDGAPETSQLTMSIGSLTMWNLGERVRSRDFQYLLHCVSLGEKHQVLEDLWQQHTEEMILLEANVLTVAGKQCTVEFQPSADMCWQSWANNEVNQAATNPSPYANVNKGNIATMGGSIGFTESDLWRPYTNSTREEHVTLVDNYVKTLPATNSDKTKHDKKLGFMAAQGIRQLGLPRIGIFADRQRPEPLHCEINAWQQILSIIYMEFVQRNIFEEFVKVLGAPISISAQVQDVDVPMGNQSDSTVDELPTAGCGLSYLVPLIKEHHADEKKRHTKIPTRLIGDQAISLARYGYRLVDSLAVPDESEIQRVKCLALERIVLYLRHACTVFNKVSTTPAELLELDENCKLYFNLMCLFFPSHINVTTWTVAYAIPYHAFKMFETYTVGYGIISQQAKEAKHSGVKNDLALSNRSTKVDSTGKWWQVMRANYVRSFYLPENQPMPSAYKSHFKSRIPPHCDLAGFCNCGREMLLVDADFCQNCLENREIVMCAAKEELSEELTKLLKPVSCRVCGNRFADEVVLQTHLAIHTSTSDSDQLTNKNPKKMSVAELKNELRKMNLSIAGKKEVLVKRLESRLVGGN